MYKRRKKSWVLFYAGTWQSADLQPSVNKSPEAHNNNNMHSEHVPSNQPILRLRRRVIATLHSPPLVNSFSSNALSQIIRLIAFDNSLSLSAFLRNMRTRKNFVYHTVEHISPEYEERPD